MKISFIIPTRNEEQRITGVVSQFAVLNDVVDYEVIVSDAESKDRTADLASSLGAKVCIDTSEHKTIAKGRNLGAKMASGDIFVFCDADTLLQDPVRLVSTIKSAFTDTDLVAALPRLAVFPSERIWKDKIFHTFFNGLIRFSLFMHAPFAFGQCQIVRASSFRQIGGYNEEQVHAEDSALYKKLGKIGKLRILKDDVVLESPRRYRQIGYLRLMMTSVYSIIGQAVFRRNVLKSWERID